MRERILQAKEKCSFDRQSYMPCQCEVVLLAENQELRAEVERLKKREQEILDVCGEGIFDKRMEIRRLKEALEAAKISMFKSPEPYEPGDVELRQIAIEKIQAVMFPALSQSPSPREEGI